MPAGAAPAAGNRRDRLTKGGCCDEKFVMATRTINWRWSSRPESDSFRRDEIDYNPAPFERRRIYLSSKLRWRLTRWFGAAVCVVGFAAISLSNYTLPGVLRRHAAENASLPTAPAAEAATMPASLSGVSIVPEADSTCVAITLLILATMAIAVAAARVVFGWLTRPFVDLAERAEEMSRGSLGLPIAVSGSDSMAQLGAALERIRRLLYAAIRRLNAEYNLSLLSGARRLSLPPVQQRFHRD